MDFTHVKPYSFGGATQRLNDGSKYKTKLVLSNALLASAASVETERADNFPAYGGLKLNAREYQIAIEVLSGGTVEELQGWLDTTLGQQEFRVQDGTLSSYYYVYAKIEDAYLPAPNLVMARMKVHDPIWKSTATSSTVWNVTSSGGTTVINNPGSYYVEPIIKISPQAARAGGYGYRRFVAIYNKTNNAANNYPVNVLGTTLDHAALVTAGKCQADGDDFRVVVNSRNSYRWEGGNGWNGNALKVWTNLSFAPRIQMNLGVAIAASGAITTITFTSTMQNVYLLKRLVNAPRKILMIGNEIFTFDTVYPTLLKVTGVQRAQKDTAEEAHSINDVVYWIQNEVWVIYGNATVGTAPAPTTDELKPMIDLVNSTNQSLVWEYYIDAKYPGRPLSWHPVVEKSFWKNLGGTTNYYRATHGAGAQIASVMGAKMAAFYYKYVWRTEQATIRWGINLPLAGGTACAATIEKYRYSTSFPASCVGLQVMEDINGVWETIWTEATPGTAGTWGTVAHAATSLGTEPMQSVSFCFQGSLLGSANNVAMFEVDGVTLTLASSEVLSVSLGAENSSYHAEVTLENVTTSQSITLEYPSAVGKVITINCDKQTIFGEDGTNLSSALSKDTNRIEWMRFDPGDNTLKYTEVGVADVDVTITFVKRSL